MGSRAAGEERALVAADRPYRVIGTRPVRPDGTDKVTGRAAYGGDIRLPRIVTGILAALLA